jgi:hypothetical protein
VVTGFSIAKSGQPAGYIDWVRTATTSTGASMTVVATATGGIAGPNNIVANFLAAATGTVTGQTTARTVFFSFQSAPRPNYINWDPSLGYGTNPNSGAGAAVTGMTPLALLLSTILAAVVAAVAVV